jgi:hypothetical protein
MGITQKQTKTNIAARQRGDYSCTGYRRDAVQHVALQKICVGRASAGAAQPISSLLFYFGSQSFAAQWANNLFRYESALGSIH